MHLSSLSCQALLLAEPTNDISLPPLDLHPLLPPPFHKPPPKGLLALSALLIFSACCFMLEPSLRLSLRLLDGSLPPSPLLTQPPLTSDLPHVPPLVACSTWGLCCEGLGSLMVLS